MTTIGVEKAAELGPKDFERLLLRALTSMKKGDFSVRMPVEFVGVQGKVSDTLNDILDLQERTASEIERISNVVGKEGKLNQRAQVPAAGGQWGIMADSVNNLITDLVQPTNEIARVIGAVAKGDLTRTMAIEFDSRPLKGEFLRTAKTVNTMVAQLASFASEVTRVAREVGTEGKLGGQADVKGVSGTWKDLTESVNMMASNLTGQVRNIAEVTTAVANGDLSKKITVEVRGEILELKNTINVMVDQLRSFASEVTRVAREVGSEGKLGGQADVQGVSGTWRDLTDSVNYMASNLTNQVRNIAAVTTAVANGDLSKQITVDARGEILDLKETINTMVDQLRSFASEVTRVAREVGTEGKLGGQAEVKGVSGTWKDLTDSVNYMAGNLTSQVRNIAEVTTAVANGDLSKKITAEALGEVLELKNTINTMVDQLRAFASEVTRVAREVGTEGRLGGQAEVPGVAGTWKDLTDSVNAMAGNLTAQVRNIADVTTAVANGDLSKKITVEVRGEILELKNTINVMVDQLNSFAAEVTRVAREVGTEGQLGGQAEVPGVAGTWKDLTDSVNSMASNLTAQVRNIAEVTTAVAMGDLSKKITVEVKGEILELKDTINVMVDQLSAFAAEVTRVAREVGTEGQLGGQAEVIGVAGTWKDLTDSVNSMAGNLTAQVRNIAEVTTAVAMGDLSKKITVEVKGEILELKNTINVMVDQLSAFASEVTRVAREVGTEGRLGGQAEVKGVAGTWKDLTDSVNSMASNLTAQVRNIADVTTAVAMGDLSKKITVEVKGEILELKNTINVMVDQLSAFASEVTRVAREVGTEGMLGGQAEVKGVAGTWKDLTDSVNSMASNLTAQVRNIAEVTTAVALGDLSRKITVEVRGEILELKDTINVMVDQLRSFAAEVTRVAREVGTEGKLGGQADVQGVSGTWKDLTDSVNYMAANLTAQVRNIADVTTAVANGDLSKKITVDVKGEVLELKNTINSMVDQLNSFASEVTRVAREVGVEGKLGGQAQVKGVAGTWKDLTDNVNMMASNLTAQVRNIAQVTTAVANGDLSKKITVDVRGEILELKDTINTMVDQLNSFAAEVTRVAREVGTEGMLGGQAEVKGVSGTWKDLTDSVNSMASNLTAQVRNIAEVTTAVALGDLSRKITVDVRGEILELKNTINTMVDQLNSFASEVTRVAREVGTEGRLGGQAQVKGVSGTWKDLTDNVNMMASNLTNQVRNIAQVTTAVANGDLSKKITVDVKGEILELKDTINTMVDQLNSFASEVTRVAREVGTEGKLGGQAQVKGVAGTWKDLTDNVNMMASNLTSQVRGIARVVTAIAKGNLKQKLAVEARGEIAELGDTINDMIETLATFADQVTTVAREVGVEGRLGGQANVPGAAGTWRDLTDNVNQLAANLTTQVRAIADVATAVTKGDLTRNITVEAQGELAALKGNINEMIRNLRETTARNAEQDWLKTNLAKFTRMMQGQKNLQAVSQMILSELAPVVSAAHGVFYTMDQSNTEDPRLKLTATYAYRERKNLSKEFRVGESLIGQAAFEKQRILITNAPEDYVQINSGLGEAKPLNIIVLPIVFEGSVLAVMELASFTKFTETYQSLLDQLTESIGVVLNTIQANMRTEELLTQSQSLAEELQAQQEELTETNKRLEQQAKSLQTSEELLRQQQEELQQTNEELEEKARLLTAQNEEVEQKNREVEQAKRQLEEKARQLALTSKYKSEFLANMSHELRTPLNSLLILAKLLSDNPEGNLTDKQVDFARTIHGSGQDLLTLINDILDLSKIESGMMTVSLSDVPFREIADLTERTFRQVANDKNITFTIDQEETLPPTIHTDPTRLQQVLKNLLGNAFKFTEKGGVKLKMDTVASGWTPGHDVLDRAASVVAFSVTDTGIGIPDEKQRIIFEAFQQADASTTRKFGGTGLGLSISREIARLLGGEIGVTSELGSGSTFILYLPQTYVMPHSRRDRAEQEQRMNEDAPLHADHSGDMNERFPELARVPSTEPEQPTVIVEEQVPDDRDKIVTGDRTVLIVEDDVNFARILIDMARDKGFKAIASTRGEAAIQLAHRYRPDAITLDIALPDMEGWTVLDRLKHDRITRHIPVHIISGDEETSRGLRLGAFAQMQKPVTKESLDDAFAKIQGFLERQNKSLLVVEDNEQQRNAIVELIGDTDVDITAVGTGEEALNVLRERRFDCMVLDLGLPDMSGFEFINRMKGELGVTDVPVVVYTGRELSRKEENELKRIADAIIVKDVRSPDRLLDETALFLHRVEENLPEQKRKMLEQLHESDPVLAGKKALIVDDDMRNIYALTSLLERHKMKVLYAESGAEGIDILKATPDIDVVLMDVMMPEMDGYEAMRRIRAMDEYKNLPMIALTAKAMKGDREKCMEAGASDYITKPIDAQQLVSLLRVWLYR
ncbi:MAG TPA: HAMP domain-containing protein [Thermoanaerobaculia bacterium]|jgi:HAMP domain-containing protein/CheY-like chemotaxis protein/signal transduction histidine kinase|nr:HAMP domain-containing protein [Thermoanaerobaculia bacterium]